MHTGKLKSAESTTAAMRTFREFIRYSARGGVYLGEHSQAINTWEQEGAVASFHTLQAIAINTNTYARTGEESFAIPLEPQAV